MAARTNTREDQKDKAAEKDSVDVVLDNLRNTSTLKCNLTHDSQVTPPI